VVVAAVDIMVVVEAVGLVAAAVVVMQIVTTQVIPLIHKAIMMETVR
jgi:hypothetical protein